VEAGGDTTVALKSQLAALCAACTVWGFASDSSLTIALNYDKTTAEPGSPIGVTANISNTGDQPIHGFFLSAYAPAEINLAIDSVHIEGLEYTGSLVEPETEEEPGWGAGFVRITLQLPPLLDDAPGTIPAGGTVEIFTSVTSDSVGEYRFGRYSYAAWDKGAGAGLFGYAEDSSLTEISIQSPVSVTPREERQHGRTSTLRGTCVLLNGRRAPGSRLNAPAAWSILVKETGRTKPTLSSTGHGAPGYHALVPALRLRVD
jgi:hypothetical protein